MYVRFPSTGDKEVCDKREARDIFGSSSDWHEKA